MATKERKLRERAYATYGDALIFIALNDEPTSLDKDVIKDQVSVVFAADLFHRTPEQVAIDVIATRNSEAKVSPDVTAASKSPVVESLRSSEDVHKALGDSK